MESEPVYEPEECECASDLEEDGIEYTLDFYWDDSHEAWVCEHCGRHQ